MRIGLFATCIGDTMFPESVSATAKLLTDLGNEVVFPQEQTCCGQMHLNSGYPKELKLREEYQRRRDRPWN